MTQPEWQPGDPLWSREQGQHSRYFFNFRDDDVSEECSCSDAASWPEPRGFHRLSPGRLGSILDDL